MPNRIRKPTLHQRIILATALTCLFSLLLSVIPYTFGHDVKVDGVSIPHDDAKIAETSHDVTTTENTGLTGTERLVTNLAQILGPTGFLGWFCYYTVSRTLPAKDAERAAEQDKNREELGKERETFTDSLNKILDANKETMDRLVDSLNRKDEAMLQVVQKCPGRAV
jgi:hypothetical protein